MKLTDAMVYKLEHNILLDLEFWAFTGDHEARDVAMYVAGVRDMAQAVIDAMQEVKNV